MYTKAGRPCTAIFPVKIPLLSLHSRPPIADLQSFVSHQVVRPGAASSRWNLVFNRHPMQLDCHCAPGKRPYPVEHVSCSGLDLRTESTMTHWLHCPLHYTRRERDPHLETLSEWLFPKISPLDIQSSRLLLDLVPPSSLTATASWVVPVFRLAERLAMNGAWLSPSTAETITATSSNLTQ